MDDSQDKKIVGDIFVKYVEAYPNIKKIFPFELKRYIFLCALRDYFEEKIDIMDMSTIAMDIYWNLSETTDFDGNYIATELGSALDTAEEIEYYYSIKEEDGGKGYEQYRKALLVYYEKNKHLIEDKNL